MKRFLFLVARLQKATALKRRYHGEGSEIGIDTGFLLRETRSIYSISCGTINNITDISLSNS